VSSKLEYFKAEQKHKLLSSNEQLTHEQQQAGQLTEQILALQKELENKQVAFVEQQESITSKTHENNDLTIKINTLEQAIEQLEQNEQVAQQQYETKKQRINAKWLNDQEKNAEILQRTSDDNEQIIKQMHDAERNKQALENELANVKGELTSVTKQQLQVLDTVKSLEGQVQKEQAVTTLLSEEKIQLEESLVQAEHENNNNNEQQDQKIAALTKEFAAIVIEGEGEGKNTQQNMAKLEQKNQAQVKQITSLTEQVDNEQLKFKQTIDKKDENHQQIVTGHQQNLADKNAALTELQRQADKTSTELSQQLNTQAALLSAESAKFVELQQSHYQLEKSKDKISQDLSEKQQQLTVVEAELAADRAATEKYGLLHQQTKEKQEVEYNKARETIKYLRDENTELNRKLEQQINALEDKLTEYRLRFDYAQKQLTKLTK
jgi:chromosome segregation ATPase